MSRRTTFHISCLSALLATSCRVAPKPLALMPTTPAVRYATIEPPATSLADSPAASTARSIELHAIASPPAGKAIAQAAAAIVQDRGVPFRGKSRLPIGCRWLSPQNVQSWLASSAQRTNSEQQKLGQTTAILTPPLRTSVQVACPTNTPAWPDVQLRCTTTGTVVTLSTAATDESPREVLLIADAIVDGEPAGLFMPDPRIAGGGLLLLLLPTTPPTTTALAAAIKSAQPPPEAPDLDEQTPKAWQVARDAVGERNRRPALLALTTPLRLARVVDLILCADEPALIAITKNLAAVAPSNAPPTDDARATGEQPPADQASSDLAPKDLGWRIERATWRSLLTRLERHELTPALRAAVRRHIGAVDDDPATLQLLLQTCTDATAFQAALTRENLAALADRSAATRVAAVTWLQQNQIALGDYDPMADKMHRRHAVRRLLAQQEGQR